MGYYTHAVHFHDQVVPYPAHLAALGELHHALPRVKEHFEADCLAADDLALAGDGSEVERLLSLVLCFVGRVEACHLHACLGVRPRPLLHVVTELLPGDCWS